MLAFTQMKIIGALFSFHSTAFFFTIIVISLLKSISFGIFQNPEDMGGSLIAGNFAIQRVKTSLCSSFSANFLRSKPT